MKKMTITGRILNYLYNRGGATAPVIRKRLKLVSLNAIHARRTELAAAGVKFVKTRSNGKPGRPPYRLVLG